MHKLKDYYLAGEVGAAIGVQPNTLRVWRDRDLCSLGHTELVDGKENHRARRRYTPVDICQMAVALRLVEAGFSHKRAFEWVEDPRRNGAIIDAYAAGVVDLKISAFIICVSRSGPIGAEQIITSMKYSGAETLKPAFAAEINVEINVEHVVARILATLAAGVADASPPEDE